MTVEKSWKSFFKNNITDLITQLTVRSFNGPSAKGLTKSSRTTALIELRHVESELKRCVQSILMKLNFTLTSKQLKKLLQ
jgi:hypothetical protein